LPERYNVDSLFQGTAAQRSGETPGCPTGKMSVLPWHRPKEAPTNLPNAPWQMIAMEVRFFA